MKKYFFAFLIASALSVFVPFAFWSLGANSKDFRYFIDYLFMAGVSLFLFGKKDK